MNKFNLSFSGEIVTGQEPEEVKRRFSKLFAIDDPVRLERFFCGETIILRRNLERKEAAHYFQEMRKLGAVGELVKVTASQAMNSVASPPSPVHNTSPADPGKQIEIAFGPKTPPPETDKADRAPATDPNPNPDSDPATGSSGKNTKDRGAKTGKPRRRKKKVASAQRGLTQQQRKTTEKTAQQKPRKVKAGREATEETERRQALLEEAVRKAGEAVRQKEHQRETTLKAADATAGQEAPGEETEAKAIEKVARQEPQREEARARSAEEVAREEALREEAERKKAAGEAARQKALREEAKRKKAAEEAARQKAQREEAKHKAAEKAARQKALREEAERKKAAEEAARQKALREEAKRRAAEEAARLQAELEEQRRREIAETARLEAELSEIERQQNEQAAKLRAEIEEKARQAEAEAARIKAEAEHKKEEAKRRSLERRRGTPLAKSAKSAKSAKGKQRDTEKQQVAQPAMRTKAEPIADKPQQAQDTARQQEESTPRAPAGPGDALQDQAAASQAQASTKQPALKPLKGRVKTNLEVPLRITGQAAATQVKRKRQPGEPNLYQLRAFRNTSEVRGRAELARRRMRHGFILGAFALAGLLILGGSFLRRAPVLPVAGADAIAINLQSGPVMLAAGQLLLHDRAGIGTEQVAVDALGVSGLQAPMAFDGNGNLLAMGQLQGNIEQPAEEALQLLRCDLKLRKCQQFSPQLAGTDIGALAINTIDNSLLLADRLTNELLKLDDQGEILLRAEIPMAEQPTLRLHSGLLFMNSAQGPAISVFRYDDKAFGQQLDEVLLLPPAAAELEQTRTGDFVWSGNAWWVSLRNPISGSVGLYRFSADWSYLNQVELSRQPAALRLNAWGEKTLVNDQQSIEVQRFNAQGGAEVPLVSGLLKELVDGQRRSANSTALAWRAGLLLCAVLAAAGFCLGYLQRLRVLVYKSYHERGADPVDDYVDSLQWIDPVENRRGRLRRRGFSYALLSIALVLMGIGNSVSALQLAALFIVLSGPAMALALWSRRPVGHIGILGQSLLLVDPRGIYHMGEGSQVHYRGSFLLIDDIVVFTGNRLLPAFSPQQVQGLVKPIAASGIRVDFNTVLVKLLQSQHPLAQGVIAILATATTAVVLLGLQGISSP